MRWGAGVKHPVYRFECAVCMCAWEAGSRQSKCLRCNAVYHPVKAYGDFSKRVKTKEAIPEQMELRIYDGANL